MEIILKFHSNVLYPVELLPRLCEAGRIRTGDPGIRNP